MRKEEFVLEKERINSESALKNQMHSARGWRAEIGMLAPLPGMYREYDIIAPEGVKFSKAILGEEQETPEELKKMNERIEFEAKKLNLCYKSDLICLGCTSSSFIGGPNYDKGLIKRIESASGSPATTTITCVLELFKDMDIKKIALIGPYKEDIFDIEVNFFEHNGIECLYVKGLGLVTMPEFWNYYMDPYACYHLVKKAVKSVHNIDCVFVTCMLSWILGIADTLEREIKLPVISSSSATLYGILKKLEIPDPVYHFGEALRLPRLPK